MVNNPTLMITFDHVWAQRFAVAFSICGSILNGLYVCLKRTGPVFQASVGLSDMIITAAVIPTTAVLLLSGENYSKDVCYTLQFLTEASTYNYSVFFAMMSLETFYRLSKPTQYFNEFILKRIDLISSFIFLATFSTAGVGVYFGLDYDCCYRLHSGNLEFRILTSVMFHIIPCLITIYYLISACFEMKHHASIHDRYRRSRQYKNDRYEHYINIAAFILYVVAWMPYLVFVYGFTLTSDSTFYQSVWVGVGRSLITSFLYCVLDRNIRRAFAHLIKCCCCQTATSDQEARVRFMNDDIITYSPRRPALCPRDRDPQ